MTGPDICTLFVPQTDGYTAVILRGVHWQEEIVGTKGVDSTGMPSTKRVVRVYAPLSCPIPEDIARLCGSCYLVRCEDIFIPKGADVLTVMSAVKCEYGSPALRHWELLAQ